MKERLIERLAAVSASLGIKDPIIHLEYPEDPAHGDFSTNLALAYGKKLGMPPRALAEKIAAAFAKDQPEEIQSVDIAGPGFINFKVRDGVFFDAILKGTAASRPAKDRGKKVMVEYTDPNPFKVFHIGHLMSNAIGESISRLIEYSGATVIRANWQGDVGPHVAKALWGALRSKDKSDSKNDFASVDAKWGYYYAFGSRAYDEDEKARTEIEDINKKIYEKSDKEIDLLYNAGRQESLDAFEKIYKRLGTSFNNYFFEGIEGKNGEAIVREFVAKGVFEESDGAVVFKGEKYGLHTRVFITSKGLPTYECKEIGLNIEKFKLYPDLDRSIIITANEQNDYFKVILKVFQFIRPEIARKTAHMSHGLMRFAEGKMSSRKGNVVGAESLIDEIKAMVMERIADRGFPAAEADELSDAVAVAAIKYTILRSSVGSDIIFDSASSISFEGDSGPYLQYAAVRAQSVLAKAGTSAASKIALPEKAGPLERMIARFPDIAERACEEYAPQHIANYLINLAGAFNAFYGTNTIADPNEPLSPYRIALTRAFLAVMTEGLWILGIKVPKKM